MGDDVNESVSGSFQNIFLVSPHQTLLFTSPGEQETRQLRSAFVDCSPRLSTNLHGGQGHDINPVTTQANIYIYQGPSHDYSFRPAPYANEEYHEILYQTPQRGPLHIIPQQIPPSHHQTQPLIGHRFQRNTSNSNTEALNEISASGQRNTQTGQGSSIGYIQPPCAVSTLPQGGAIDSEVSPTQRSRVSVRDCPCPVPGCKSSFFRPQEQRRHLLSHLPHWIRCPDPGCSWRGNRLGHFKRHRGRDHPSSIQDPDEDQYKIYNPQSMVEKIAKGSLLIQVAKSNAISMVIDKARKLGDLELRDNPWGRRVRKTRKHR
ncbi:hypothetical protein F5148DRAFT_1204911 [Russula earlei]|uniref:Uncharacterized protein n=1 Tax=Russula earlei TaxID=71964 RepID=A0ACC0U8J9_9AGAM|nr:hypothetical protein F5148DRAFT_1204911 [Russula earlei]